MGCGDTQEGISPGGGSTGAPPTQPPTPTGLRKLEAFFGLLITIMALTFGYEVKDLGGGGLGHPHPSLVLWGGGC